MGVPDGWEPPGTPTTPEPEPDPEQWQWQWQWQWQAYLESSDRTSSRVSFCGFLTR